MTTDNEKKMPKKPPQKTAKKITKKKIAKKKAAKKIVKTEEQITEEKRELTAQDEYRKSLKKLLSSTKVGQKIILTHFEGKNIKSARVTNLSKDGKMISLKLNKKVFVMEYNTPYNIITGRNKFNAMLALIKGKYAVFTVLGDYLPAK